ncbi:MAG: hypothetical protein PHU46_11575 [Rhodocyclaceae bacterium]|nr:hypothetical protein [Rhodocyclaceae bacterium]
MVKQRIDGNDNIQVGRVEGDLTIGPDDPLDPDNPNLVECPSCWKLASRSASPCPRCGYNIAGHFAALVQVERDKAAQRNMMLAFMFFMGAGLLIGLSWFPESLKGPLAFAALAGLFVAASSAGRNRRR